MSLTIGFSRSLFVSVPRSSLANLDGGFEYRPDRENSSQFMPSNCCQIHGSNAPTRSAIRISAELARCDLGLQVCRQGLSREREYTILRTVWWRRKLPNHLLRHVQLWILRSQLHHILDGPFTLLRAQDFWHFITDLRREHAEPYLLDLWARCPEF